MSLNALVPLGRSKNLIATIAIGGKYYREWYDNAFPSWKRYCLKHDLGLVVFDEDLVSRDDDRWKKATWQKMLLAKEIHQYLPNVENVCYLDTDILINHYAPNIFNFYNNNKIGLVSMVKNIPFDREVANRKISFLRHTYYDKQYPLDSAILMSRSDLYKYHSLTVQNDLACMGLIVFNVNNHKDIMEEWFNKYDRNVESITGGGDQTHINYEVQSWGGVMWLDYKFQALWNYEISLKYPFLYGYGRNDQKLIQECVEASLTSNYFLHFAGSWYESNMWKLGDVFLNEVKLKELDEYYQYLSIPVTGKPQGMVKPS